MRLRPTSIRTRLTLAFTAIFGLILCVYISGTSYLHYRQLNEQLYDSLVQDLETVEGLLYFAPDGRLLLYQDYHSRPESRLLLDRLMEVLDSNGQVLFRNDKLGQCDLGGSPLPHEFSHAYYARRFRICDGTPVLSISHLHPFKGRVLLLRVAYSTDPLRTHLFDFLGVSALAMPLALIIAGLGGYRMASTAMQPLENMAVATERITADRLSERIPVGNPRDELGHMARVLNNLLQRLQESFENLRRFTSDVSHELRTPLSSMRSVGEVALQTARTPDDYRDIIGSMLEEVGRLNSVVDTLFTMARADYGSIELHRTQFSLEDLVQEAVGIVSVLAEEKQQTILASGHSSLSVSADRGFLRMALINLLDNAIKYSPTGSTIRLAWHPLPATSGQDHMLELSIADQGPGIQPEYRSRIFERFFRLDEGRNRASGGAGLGLSIVKCAVEAHAGLITVHDNPGGGALFRVALPVLQSSLVQ